MKFKVFSVNENKYITYEDVRSSYGIVTGLVIDLDGQLFMDCHDCSDSWLEDVTFTYKLEVDDDC